MLLRVRDYGKAHQEHFPESTAGEKAFATVARVIDEIDAHATEKLSAPRESQRTKAARRQIILDRMQMIARTSKGVRTAAGAALNLPMPARKSDVAVLAAARSFLKDAEPLQDQFVSLGLPSTCLTELREATEAFDAALSERRTGRSGVAGASAGIKAALTEGIDAARTLDIVVQNTVGNDPVLLASWERDRRIVGWRGKSEVSDDAPTPELTNAAAPKVDAPAAPAVGETKSAA